MLRNLLNYKSTLIVSIAFVLCGLSVKANPVSNSAVEFNPLLQEKGQMRQVKLLNRRDVFFKDSTNYYEKDTYLLKLRKNQKIEIRLDWEELDKIVDDRQGTFDPAGSGFQILLPNGKPIEKSSNSYLLEASVSGIYQVVVAPSYKAVNTIYIRKQARANYKYRINFLQK